MRKLIVICIMIGGCWYAWVYHTPYQTFMRECRYNEFLEGKMGDQYCTWLYGEMIVKERSWLRETLKKLRENSQ